MGVLLTSKQVAYMSMNDCLILKADINDNQLNALIISEIKVAIQNITTIKNLIFS